MKKLYIGLLILLTSCALTTKKTKPLINEKMTSTSKENLKFIADFQFNSKETFDGVSFGGLSSLSYKNGTSLLYAVSDDRGERGLARLYKLKFKLTNNSLEVSPHKALILKDERGRDFKSGVVDFEGMAITNRDEYIISTEGDNRTTPPIQPKIMKFSIHGKMRAEYKVPKKFKVAKDSGIYNNNAFEGLDLTPNNKFLIVAMEDSLKQDGELATHDKASLTRFIKYKKVKRGYWPVAEYAYPLSKVPHFNGDKKFKGGNGISAILAVNHNEYIVVERSFSPTLRRNTIRLFKASVKRNTTNIKKMTSIKNAKLIPLKKEFIADLDAFLPDMKGQKRLDNIEGITFGPKIDGKKTIILVSDDNFSKYQRTIFLAFKMK